MKPEALKPPAVRGSIQAREEAIAAAGARLIPLANELDLLEREPFLEALAEELARVEATGSGRLVLVTGEAGVGKTVLLRRFCKVGSSARCLSGACDALLTPRALGPLVDVADEVGGPLAELLRHPTMPRDALRTLLIELRVQTPTVLVLEDVHWADDATLDLLRLLGRRVDGAPALVLVSLRDDELDRTHPLRIVLGELATSPHVRRLQLPGLSLEAVRRLAEPHGVDAEELYAKTAGNPFYVTEMLHAGTAGTPATVSDAVLARAARLSAGAQRVLEAVAVTTPHAELWLLELLVGEDLPHLEECLAFGMCRNAGGAVAFRHELARVALEESIAPDRRLALHRAALQALIDPPRGAPDPARVAHHAEQAGESEAVLVFAPAAGARAARLNAHREAAAQYARALRFADGLTPARRADLLDRRSVACYLSERLEEAVEACSLSLAAYRAAGDELREGESLQRLSRLHWCVGRTQAAEDTARQAVELLERFPPGRELALAYANVANLRACAEENDAAIEWGRKTIVLADELGELGAKAHALISIGAARVHSGSWEGFAEMERAISVAGEAGLIEHVVRARSNIGAAAVDVRAYELADRELQVGIDFLVDLGVSYWLGYLLAMRARSAFEQGHWSEAIEFAEPVLVRPSTVPLGRLIALVVLGRVRTRRGDPRKWQPLDEARRIAAPTGELQWLGPVAVARAEAALHDDDPGAVRAATDEAFELAALRRSPWLLGELARLRQRAGIEEPVPQPIAEPFALELAGSWAEAAARWSEIGCPYEAAAALAAGADENPLRRALARFEELGARPAASQVTAQLRELVARGPRTATTENPANLTPREVEVLALVATGLRNADIAEQLVVSQRTIDHHVSAILRKLGVRSRAEAGVAAVRLGITPDT